MSPGIMGAATKLAARIFGTKHEKDIKRLRPVVDEINEHYAQLAGLSDEELRGRTAAWQARQDGSLFWPVDGYAVEGRRTTDWLAQGVVKYHRMLGTTLNALIAAGLAIRHVEEWHPTAQQIAAAPALAKEMERPMMVLVSATR